jgi:elongation factor Ts
MTEITLEMVKKLREQTAVSIMQCKKALEEADGDLEKAKIALTKKSGEIAAKKGDRELLAGIIISKIEGDKGIIMEFACETDFVANNEDFNNTANSILEKIFSENLEKDSEEIKTLLSEATQKFGERVDIAKIEIFEGNLGKYIHSNNSVGALISFENEVSEELGKDIAMHISAQNPKYLKTDDIDSSEREKAQETLREEVADKPAEMQEKILEGKMNSYFKERVLLTQAFIKNPDLTIEKLLEENKNSVIKFVRMGVGEV